MCVSTYVCLYVLKDIGVVPVGTVPYGTNFASESFIKKINSVR